MKTIAYKYETHLHTSPVSKCAKSTVREMLEFYKGLGYEGIFVTNHFIQGNMTKPEGASYEELVEFYFSDYEEALRLSPEIGIRVFLGVEISYGGTDFLIFGLDKAWYLDHPEILDMRFSDELRLMRDAGAFISQAHPFREAAYIDHIRLFPRCIEAVEVINACRLGFENDMAAHYAEAYGLLKTAGSDIHCAPTQKRLAGITTERPIKDELDFINMLRKGEVQIFTEELEKAVE